MGNQIYKQISKFAEMQRDEIKREKAKKNKGIKKKPDYSTIQIVSTKEEDN